MGLLSEHLDWRNIHSDSKKIDPRFGDVSAAEIFNKLVKAIRSEWKTKKIQAKVNAMKKRQTIGLTNISSMSIHSSMMAARG